MSVRPTPAHLDQEATISVCGLSTGVSIFLVSLLALFLEMMLIRWVGTEIRIFAYLQNTVLIVCFFGMGVGCFSCQRPVRARQIILPLLALTTILAVPWSRAIAARITDLLSVLSDLLIWEHAFNVGAGTTMLRVVLGSALTFLLMVLFWEMFVPLGRLLGRLMNQHPNVIKAYSLNVLGSLIGIWLFVGLSALWLPPVIWLAAAAGLLLFYSGRGRELATNAVLLAAVLLTGWLATREPQALVVAWSPYQKLVLTDNEKHPSIFFGQYLIAVNNAGYQAIMDLRPERESADTTISPELRGMSQYDIPLMFHDQPRRVLLVGAGSGNDAAGALRGGAEQVTAVEIDPAIIAMGKQFHPERPYQSDKVTVVNDDARSFFATCQDKFDLIVFGLLDSHTTTAMTNARLDHYVYTRESIALAHRLLADNGVMVLSFEAVKPYIADRMSRCLSDEFGRKPLVFRVPPSRVGWGGVMFVAGDEGQIEAALAADTRLRASIERWQAAHPVTMTGETRVATDDWPYIYLERARIPTLYFLLAALTIGLIYYAKYRLQSATLVGNLSRDHWHFFFLGAAFLLLEVQNVSKASVVLGNTWVVSAVIISAILCMILLANLIAARWSNLPLGAISVCLIGSCIGLYFVDLAKLGSLPAVFKVLAVGALTTLPMLFSGIIFIRSFAAVEDKSAALGANLMGSLLGGMLQSLTFITGIKALLLVVAAFYVAALVCSPVAARRMPKLDEDDADALDGQRTEVEDEEQLPELVGA